MVWELTTFFVIAIYALTIISTILMMMMENRSPVKSIAWIIVLLVIPGFGLLIYVFFGRKFRKKMVISHRSLEKWHQRVAAIESDPVFGKSFPLEYRNMALLALHSSNAHLYINTDVRIFTDGPSLFDSIFEEMEKAEKFIHVEYYVFLSDEIGTRFINILKRKAAQGLEVRVIIDDVGSWMLKKSEVKKMREAGIQVYCFLKVGLPFLSSKINYRNHRKILVIDGKVGFTGGMNVADRYVKGSKWGTWRDTHLRLEGEGVHGLQRTFMADWFFVSRTLLRNDALYYPDVQSFGSSVIQVVASGPDSQWESIMQVLFMAMAQARKYIYLETPYFLPNTPILHALQVASLGGTDVRIILPRHSDAAFALRSSCSYIDDMLKAGVKVYFYNPGFIHSKTIVIDDKLSTVGTANMDFRSFEQNFEVNTLIYDPEVAARMKATFETDLANSTPIDPMEWKRRPRLRKLGESWARLFSPLM